MSIAQALAWYYAHIDGCPRSAEWKHGARAGCFKAHGLAHERSPWPSGTAQDDARNAGFQYGYEQAKHELKAGGAL
jgi:hypothetical protein